MFKQVKITLSSVFWTKYNETNINNEQNSTKIVSIKLVRRYEITFFGPNKLKKIQFREFVPKIVQSGNHAFLYC